VRLRNRERVIATPFELALADTRAAAGTTIRGALRDLGQPADVALLRIETCPSGRVALEIASCRVEPGEDVAVPVPADAPPTVVGRECALRYAVRVRSPVSRRRPAQLSVPVEIHGGEQPVHETVHLFDRMIASFPARGFHIELAEAVLEGGGRIAGRVHVHDRAPRSIEAIVRCEETWRTNFQYRNRRQPPLWRSEQRWRDSVALERDPDRSWQPFAFAIPAGLPPAVEGHIVCWRYEVEARRRGRVGRAERAVVTPLRFDIDDG
jgi:hypothetical protein